MTKIHCLLLASLVGIYALILPHDAISKQEVSAQQTAGEETPEEPLSIHQRASLCWEDFDLVFEDEPFECNVVCETCHLLEVAAIKKQTQNPKLARAHEIYPALIPDTGEGVNWDSIDLLQQVCRDCHDDITEEHEANHTIFVNYNALLTGFSDNKFKPTELKLFDEHIFCTTCHSPHQDHEALLRMSNTKSKLCLNCHTT